MQFHKSTLRLNFIMLHRLRCLFSGSKDTVAPFLFRSVKRMCLYDNGHIQLSSGNGSKQKTVVTTYSTFIPALMYS